VREAVTGSVLLLRHDTSDSRLDMSFDTLASSGYVSGLGRASLARKYAINVLWSIYGPFFLCMVMFTLLLPFATWLAPSYVLLGDVIGLVVKYNIPRNLHPQLPPPGLVMSELSDDAIWDLSPSCMKGWKSGFFLIDQRAIPDYMSWRHLDSVLTDPKPPTGSYNQSNILVEMICGWGIVLYESVVICPFVDSPFLFAVMGIYDFLCLSEWTGSKVIPAPTPKDLAAATPNTKVLAKAEASKKRRASTSGSASSEILLITPIRSAATIPLGGKAIMDDAIDTSSGMPVVPALLLALSLEMLPVMLLTKISSLLFLGLIMLNILKTALLLVLTRLVMIGGKIEALTDKWLAGKTSVLHCLLMSYRGELLARLTSFQGLESRVSGIKNLVADLNDKVTASDAAFVKAKAKGKERKKKIKSLSKSLDQFTTEAARIASDLNQSLVQKFPASDELSRVQGELLSLSASAGFERGLHMDRIQELARPAIVPAPKVAGVSPSSPKESNVTPASSLVDFLSKDAPPFSVAATE
ncbi:hypothetical protein Tco_0689647, partial [Tanacetum coccineum]